MSDWQIIHGDALDALRKLPDASVDAMVTDPPAGIRFMGKLWDHDHGGRAGWCEAFAAVFAECLRVLKPGAHALVWAIPRTSHWTASALEDSGFEVRDVLTHHFGSGFPKSLDVSKAIDRAARQYLAASDDAKRWQGWGTALKPATEHWILARKPLAGTVAANVLAHGTGALNVDGCRVAATDAYADNCVTQGISTAPTSYVIRRERRTFEPASAGRWPSNLLLTHCERCEPAGSRKVRTGTTVNRNRSPENRTSWYKTRPPQTGEDVTYAGPDGMEEVEAFDCCHCCPVRETDAQSGETFGSGSGSGSGSGGIWSKSTGKPAGPQYADSGGASRFFPRFRYTPKASTRERNAGLEEDPNHHPTVKPVELMRWLCRLVTPPSGVVLDPFSGSGTTLVAALREGFRCIGIEREAEYVEIARRRIEEDAPLFNATMGSA